MTGGLDGGLWPIFYSVLAVCVTFYILKKNKLL